MIDLCLNKTIRNYISLVLLITLLFFVFLRISWAEQAYIFSVRGIKVDVTAGSTTDARDKALVMGQRAAFRELLERLTLRNDHLRLPSFNDNSISSFVADFEVAEEKASAVRYLATLNYSFKADDVRKLLMERKIAFAETTSKPVLVLPVYQASGYLLLWDDPNPWREAWSK